MHKNGTMGFVHCIASVFSCESIIRLHVKRGTFYRVLVTVRKCRELSLKLTTRNIIRDTKIIHVGIDNAKAQCLVHSTQYEPATRCFWSTPPNEQNSTPPKNLTIVKHELVMNPAESVP